MRVYYTENKLHLIVTVVGAWEGGGRYNQLVSSYNLGKKAHSSMREVLYMY